MRTIRCRISLVGFILATLASPCWAPFTDTDAPTSEAGDQLEHEKRAITKKVAKERDLTKTLMPGRPPAWESRVTTSDGPPGGPAAAGAGGTTEAPLGSVPVAEPSSPLNASTVILVLLAVAAIAAVIWSHRRRLRPPIDVRSRS